MTKIKNKELLKSLEAINLRLKEDFIESYEGWSEMLILLNTKVKEGLLKVDIIVDDLYDYNSMCEEVLKCADQVFQYLYDKGVVWDNEKFYSEIINKIAFYKIVEQIKVKKEIK